MIINQDVASVMGSQVRHINARVELYSNSTFVQSFTNEDRIKEITIERVGESAKFFGFGVCQKVNVKLIDMGRTLDITTANSFKIYFEDVSVTPTFKVTEVHRDEITNQLSITAYDALYWATNYFYEELNASSYTIGELASRCAGLLNLKVVDIVNVSDGVFDNNYPNGGNYEGTENIREILDDIAEATQTIYYINNEDKLIFKRLNIENTSGFVLSKMYQYELESGDNRRLATIVSTTELGDNYSASLSVTGSTQYVRDNGLWDMQDNIDSLVNNALTAIGSITINQFDCAWRGNCLLEIGDKITIIKKQGVATAYLLDDVISYDGAYSQRTKWEYKEEDSESASATSLGEVLKQTYAKVDKANKKVDIVVSEVDGFDKAISQLQIDTEAITGTVGKLETLTNEIKEDSSKEIETLKKQVEASMTDEDVTIKIQQELDNGVNKVTTATGFTFDETGLTVEKSDSEMKTQITEDGMVVKKDNQVMLTANNRGVDAVNLHATTYLIIGKNSRFEDFGSNKTACFWIGD